MFKRVCIFVGIDGIEKVSLWGAGVGIKRWRRGTYSPVHQSWPQIRIYSGDLLEPSNRFVVQDVSYISVWCNAVISCGDWPRRISNRCIIVYPTPAHLSRAPRIPDARSLINCGWREHMLPPALAPLPLPYAFFDVSPNHDKGDDAVWEIVKICCWCVKIARDCWEYHFMRDIHIHGFLWCLTRYYNFLVKMAFIF